MNIFYKIKMLVMLIVVVLVTFCLTDKSFAVARVMEFNFDANDIWTYTLDMDSDWEIDELSASGSRDLDGSIVYTVTEDNGDNSYDIDVEQTDVTLTVDGGSPQATTDGSDTMIRKDGRGQITHELDENLLLPSMDGDEFYGETISDQNGPFISTAVDVNDTWTHTYYVTPYGESQQTMNISCKLLEWTTLNGHNVGKIERTYTKPIHTVHKVDSERIVDGDLSVTEYWWFSYDEKFLVKTESTLTGTLTITSSNDPPDDEYLMDITDVIIQTVQ